MRRFDPQPQNKSRTAAAAVLACCVALWLTGFDVPQMRAARLGAPQDHHRSDGHAPEDGMHRRRPRLVALLATRVVGPLALQAVRRVLRRYLAQVQYCYESRLIVQPALAGRVTLALVIDARGAVSTATVASSTIADDEVGRCISARARTWQFPAPTRAESVAVTSTFSFTPER